MTITTKQTGGLIWITGYSGAGKTTVARLVNEKLKAQNKPVVFLDGDELRSIFGEKYGHSLEDRRGLAYVYSRLCKKISDSGTTVVISAVAMFEAVRAENRSANPLYLEVYLDVPFEVRAERDPKGLYRAAKEKASEIVGVSSLLEEPENPDLTINNYGDISPEKAASLIVNSFTELQNSSKVSLNNVTVVVPQQSAVFDRTQYWNAYYQKRSAPIKPSSFAIFCLENFLDEPCHIYEFGCGNGRDSFYFAKHHRVTAIDESIVVIKANTTRAIEEGVSSLNFLPGEFGNHIIFEPTFVDAVYSRFVMHAMNEEAEDKALLKAFSVLKNKGKLLLEFRTNKDPLMQHGQIVSESERLTDHYRRFIDLDKFCEKVLKIGFTIDYKIEKQGLATHGNDDPVVARVIAIKP